MKAKIEQLVSYVESSLYFCNEAFNEIWNITQTPSTEDEYGIVSGHPFHFYSVTLQYCFVMEYTKLLDKNSSNEKENVASLFKLNKSAMDFLGDSFKPKYLENKKLLNEICKSELYWKLKKLRNRKFGHSENDEINDPFKIEGFDGSQIEEIKNQVMLFLRILNNVLGEVQNSNFDLHNDSRTANFIRFHAKYKQYYHKNYMKAMEEGYGLH